jgi:hypothetical protein
MLPSAVILWTPSVLALMSWKKAHSTRVCRQVTPTFLRSDILLTNDLTGYTYGLVSRKPCPLTSGSFFSPSFDSHIVDMQTLVYTSTLSLLYLVHVCFHRRTVLPV